MKNLSKSESIEEDDRLVITNTIILFRGANWKFDAKFPTVTTKKLKIR